MIKVLFSDLDGTMLSKRKDGAEVFVAPKHQQLLRQLLDQGVRVVTVSGREVEFTNNFLNQQLGFQFDAVGSNGATVTLNQQVVSHYPCDKTQLLAICEFLKKIPDINPFIMEQDGTITFLHHDRYPYPEFMASTASGNVSHIDHSTPLLEKLSDPSFANPSKMCIATAGYSQTKQWVQALNYQFGETFDFFNSSLRYIEVVVKGVNKGTGVIEICQLLGVQLDEIATVGDAENDIAMLSLTPHSFAMAHGQTMVQQQAQHIIQDYSEVLEYILHHNAVS